MSFSRSVELHEKVISALIIEKCMFCQLDALPAVLTNVCMVANQ
ncbi:hypothetical protein GBN63_20335 [Pectobacterium carotovorum]|nr:hypothetical protein GBN63_20335 [Pectobacterium carotovorum]